MSEKRKRYVALATRVLAVAVEGEVGDWAAYIDACDGDNHANEVERVYQHGTKLNRQIAEILFPDFAETLVWRY